MAVIVLVGFQAKVWGFRGQKAPRTNSDGALPGKAPEVPKHRVLARSAANDPREVHGRFLVRVPPAEAPSAQMDVSSNWEVL